VCAALAAWPAAGIAVRPGTTWLCGAFGVLATVVLALGLVAAIPSLVPLSAVLLAAGYGSALAIEHRQLDLGAAVVAAGLLLLCELAFWSLELRAAIAADPGSRLLRLAFLLGLAAAAVAACGLVLAAVDLAATGGLLIEIVGALAAVAAIGLLVVAPHRTG